MAYDKNELEKTALRAIEKEGLCFYNDLINFLPCCSKTFYSQQLQELQSIKTALEKNKISVKRKLRHKMIESDNPAMVAMAYRLMSDDQEFQKLTQNKLEHSGGNSPIILQVNKGEDY